MAELVPASVAPMRAWVVTGQPDANEQLRLVERPVPTPGPQEVLVRLRACGVCRTDLHLAAGELPAKSPEVTPGHEGVGEVVAVSTDVSRFTAGDRVGIAWLRHTCGMCRWCREGAENLCLESQYTGWDADGCFAELATVPAAFAYRLPPDLDDIDAAPLLCAGIIGFRALQRTRLRPGGRLGIYGFGASAHLTAQVALAQGAEVHVLTRGEGARALARELGATSVGAATEAPPVPLDAAITFAPAGELVPGALAALDQGGTLVIAGIHLSDVPPLDYQRHLFRERSVTSVTANTRADGEAFLRVATALGVRAHVRPYPFERADAALADLEAGRFTGAAVLTIP